MSMIGFQIPTFRMVTHIVKSIKDNALDLEMISNKNLENANQY